MDDIPSDKKPAGGLAIIVGSGKPPSAAEVPGSNISKEFLGDSFDSLKVGQEGTLTVRFKVTSKDDKNGYVDMDFTKLSDVDTTGTDDAGMDSDSEESMMDTEDGDSMEDRFEKFSKKGE